METDVFSYLVIGLAGFTENQNRCYPYPEPLRYSLNRLSLALLFDYPKTIDGLIRLFARPLQSWWPAEPPSDFDWHEPLIEDGGLSFESMAYLERLCEQDRLSLEDSLFQIGVVVDNRKFRRLLDRLRDRSLVDKTGAQGDYIALRRFINEHPFARLIDIGRVFSQTHYISTLEVNELYIKTSEIADTLQYPGSDGRQLFWLCNHCGPLYVKQGQPESIKRSVCGKHCPRNRGGWTGITPSSQLVVLRKGIHLRVHLPSIPELALFGWLEEHRQKYPELIKEVLLWPGIDTYDLQIRFIDSTWAVDIKDYEKPHQLGRNLTGLYREGDLYWNKGFYVYPAYREKQYYNYGETVRLEVGSRLIGTEILSDEIFKDRVVNKLKSLKRSRRTNHNVQSS